MFNGEQAEAANTIQRRETERENLKRNFASRTRRAERGLGSKAENTETEEEKRDIEKTGP